MKRAWIWIVAGLVVFASIYALVFPQSQMPVRITLKKLDIAYIPDAGSVYCDSEKVITSSGQVIPLPNQSNDALPEGLTWNQPKVSGFEEKDGKVYIYFPGKSYMWDKKWWETDYIPPVYHGNDMGGFGDWHFDGIKDGKLILISKSQQIKEYELDILSGIHDFAYPMFDGKTGVSIGDFNYFTTGDEDGRIIKIKDGKEIIRLDRSRFEAGAVPSMLATDGKYIYTAVAAIGELTKPVLPIQVYDSDLKYVTEFGDSRPERKVVGLDVYGSVVLLLWDDGLLEGFSKDGFLMFGQRIESDGTGLMVTPEAVFAKGKTWIGLLNIVIVKPETPVWPRIIDAGIVSTETTRSVTIKSAVEPNLTIKGSNVKIIGNSKLGDTWRIQLLINPVGLKAFESNSCELIVEMGKIHEIVPITFTPIGSVRRFFGFDGFAIDEQTGERLDTQTLEKLSGKRIENAFTREIVLLSPEPGGIIAK